MGTGQAQTFMTNLLNEIIANFFWKTAQKEEDWIFATSNMYG